MFLKTKDNIIWFAFNKINDNYICFPKKIGHYKGKKYSEWYEKTFEDLKKYKIKLEGLDESVYVVNENDINKKYDALNFVRDKKYLELKYNFDIYIDIILKAINDFFDISLKDIGIEGSILLDCYSKESDIDIIIFGKDNAMKIQKKFKKFKNYKNIDLYNKKQTAEYIAKRKKCGYGNNETTMKKQFLRRYYGFVCGKQFSIICVPYEYKEGYINLDRKIKYVDEFEGVLKIVDDKNSCVVPSTYIAIDTRGKEYIIENFNHYGINQVRKDEKIFVKGKKYINVLSNKQIIILSFWSNVEERFDLYE